LLLCCDLTHPSSKFTTDYCTILSLRTFCRLRIDVCGVYEHRPRVWYRGRQVHRATW